MRLLPSFLLTCTAAVVVACVHEDKKPVGPNLTGEQRSVAAAPSPVQYLVGEPGGGSRTSTIVIPLHGGAQGMVVDKRRVIVARGEPRVAADAPSEPITGATKLPARFGGGFLFWTEKTIYRSDAFDSALIPVVQTPEPIESISFGPKLALVRTRDNARWGIGLPKGERVPLAPLGVVDVVALDEGRALGFDDQGSVFTSLDGGAHWNDATAQVKGKPTRVFIQAEELWLEDDSSNAMRLEPDGHLAWFDHVPDENVPEHPKDPRWHNGESPVRVAVRMGVAIDEQTALVLDSGDLFRIDVRTGEIVSVIGGKLPPDATCQGMPVAGDVLFACVPRGGGSSFVVSHTLLGSDPVIEQSFSSGATFYASDDGGLAYSASCTSAGVQQPGSSTLPTVPTVCVRMPTGTWEERDVSNLSTDAGASPSDVNVGRWLPRSDGRVVAVILDPNPGLYDPVSGSLTPLGDEVKNLGRGGTPSRYYPRYYRGRRGGMSGGGMNGIIDGSWSYVGSSIRASAAHGETLEISEDGRIKSSAYELESVFYFAMGIGRSKDGRLYQTSDHGMTWTEVAAPPSGADSSDLLTCSSVGCDLGAFYRIGWSARPPRALTPATPAPPAPGMRRVLGLQLSCHPSQNAPVVSRFMKRTDSSPEDLGLGNANVPHSDEKHDWTYVRTPVSRSIAQAYGGGGPGSYDNDSESLPALRVLFSGFGTTKDDNDALIVNGPVKAISTLRRGVSYVAPFDTTGKVVRTGIQMSEVIAAARRAGLTTDEILSEDPTESGSPFPITPLDPNAVSDLGIHDPSHGLLSILRGERVRVAIRSTQGRDTNPSTLSGVLLPNDEAAFLETEGGGPEHVYKVGQSGVIDLFDVTQQENQHGPNPDALAVDAKGTLAVIRTPSGSDPASAFDSAYLVTPGTPNAPLAPWSTVKFADDPACKADPGGFRTTLQVVGPWVRVTTPDLKVEDAPMIARVRWSDKRVCLEGFEVKLPAVSVHIPQTSGSATPFTLATWLVGKGSTFARVSVGDGVEWRQPLECSVVSTGP